jgi:hypothetical protein
VPLVVVAALAASATKAEATVKPVVVKTNWNEIFTFRYRTQRGEMRLYVRKLEFTPSTWKAWVGLTNRSEVAVKITSSYQYSNPLKPFVYWSGPGIWWATLERNSSWYPGGGTVLTHSARATSVRPAYPASLATRKSWFGTFTGSLAKVPKDRLLRIGFGTLVTPGDGSVDLEGKPLMHDLPCSTTHQFRLPR